MPPPPPPPPIKKGEKRRDYVILWNFEILIVFIGLSGNNKQNKSLGGLTRSCITIHAVYDVYCSSINCKYRKKKTKLNILLTHF